MSTVNGGGAMRRRRRGETAGLVTRLVGAFVCAVVAGLLGAAPGAAAVHRPAASVDRGPAGAAAPTASVVAGPTSFGTRRGLFARYYARYDGTGPWQDRVDPVVDMDWGNGSPAAGIPADGFSAVWNGEILPRYTETYTLSLVADDQPRLWVNARAGAGSYSGDPAERGPQVRSLTLPLTAGVPVDVALAFREVSGRARVQLRWSSPSQPDEVVPTERLLPRVAFSVQPYASAPAPGFSVESGWGFCLTCVVPEGWSADVSSRIRDRRVLGDPLRDSFVHVQDARWEVAVPQGTYRVWAMSGDPTYLDSRHVLDAEGLRLLDGVPTAVNRFVTGSVDVPVTDGRLTVRGGAGGVNVKLNAVTVELL
ncbi:MAG: PA14 domain-containing protein [Kineosporiaceae bacterium]